MGEEKKQQTRHEKEVRRIRIAMWILIALAAVLSVFIYVKSLPPPPSGTHSALAYLRDLFFPPAGEYDAFAKCIANTSTTFYGAFWCPHCQNQKQEFGEAAKYLPYVECSLPDASGETPACTAQGVAVYPTWHFPDGSSSTGEQSLQTLSKKTGCPLPTST